MISSTCQPPCSGPIISPAKGPSSGPTNKETRLENGKLVTKETRLDNENLVTVDLHSQLVQLSCFDAEHVHIVAASLCGYNTADYRVTSGIGL